MAEDNLKAPPPTTKNLRKLPPYNSGKKDSGKIKEEIPLAPDLQRLVNAAPLIFVANQEKLRMDKMLHDDPETNVESFIEHYNAVLNGASKDKNPINITALKAIEAERLRHIQSDLAGKNPDHNEALKYIFTYNESLARIRTRATYVMSGDISYEKILERQMASLRHYGYELKITRLKDKNLLSPQRAKAIEELIAVETRIEGGLEDQLPYPYVPPYDPKEELAQFEKNLLRRKEDLTEDKEKQPNKDTKAPVAEKPGNEKVDASNPDYKNIVQAAEKFFKNMSEINSVLPLQGAPKRPVANKTPGKNPGGSSIA